MSQNMSAFGIREALEILVAARSDGVPLLALAELFDRLEWLLMDPVPIGIAKMQWALGDDPVLAEIALLMKEAFLVVSGPELNSILAQISAKHPDLRQLCDSVQSDWLANERLLGRGKEERT
jgi:hypothetical protein